MFKVYSGLFGSVTLVALLSMTSLVHGDIIEYEEKILGPELLFKVMVGRGMYAPQDAPAKTSPGNGRSFVHVHMQFERHVTTDVDPIDNEIWLDYGVYHTDRPDDFGQTSPCLPGGGLNLPNKGPSWRANFTNTHVVDMTYNITDTGLWYFVWASCLSGNPQLKLNGREEWMNPFGYLPGRTYPWLPFSSSMFLIYMALGIMWFIASIINWHELLRLQHYIALVIFLGVLEWTMAYFDYSALNTTGVRSMKLVVASTIATVLKKTLSRVLVLCVSMGYGVVRPTLGSRRGKVILFTIGYFAATLFYDLVVTLSRHQDISNFYKFVSIFPVSFMDAALYMWVFTSIRRTTVGLENRGQTAKLQMYQMFVRTLIASICIAGLFLLYQIAEMVTGGIFVHWKTVWIFEGFWYILSLLVLVAVMAIWRPHKNTKQYVYSQQLSSVDVDDDGTMGGVGPDTMEMRDMGQNGTNGLFTLDDESSDISDGMEADDNHPARETVPDSEAENIA